MSCGLIASSYALAFWVTVMLKGKRLSQVIEDHDGEVENKALPTEEKGREEERKRNGGPNQAVVAAINIKNRSKL